MIGLGSLNPMEDVQALIKGKVGEFLQAEGTIRRYLTHVSASIRSDAAGLMAAHKTLEQELGSAQAKIAQFQSGAWSLSDVIALGDVGTRLLQHLSRVASLERSASGVMAPQFGISSVAIPALGAVAVAAVTFIYFLRK